MNPLFISMKIISVAFFSFIARNIRYHLNSFFQKFVYIVILLSMISFHTISSQWVTGIIDTLTHDNAMDYAYSPNSIAIDNQNTLHVVWQKLERESDPNSWRIFYVKKPVNGRWTNPIAISDTLKTAVYPSILVANKLGQIFIAYIQEYDFLTSDIKLAVGTEDSILYKLNISNDSLQNRNPSIAIDNNENVHIAWLGMDSSFNDKIKYSNNLSGIWKTFTLYDDYSGDKYSAHPSISVSPNGYPHILFLSFIGGMYKNVHAENLDAFGLNWKFELLPESINNSGIFKISKSGKLNYIFNYTEGFQSPSKVFYTYKVNNLSDWTIPQLIDNNFDGYCTSIEIDNEERVHITLDSLEQAFKMGKVYYATNMSGAWVLSPVSIKENAFFSCFKIDYIGKGHIIFSNRDTNIPSELIHYESQNSLTEINKNAYHYEKDFKLFQNYPNPFNPNTIIKFNIPYSEYVKLEVYDVLGKEVNTLANKIFSAGSHSIEFKSGELSSGIYFYRIITKKYSETKKMVIIK